MRIYDAHKNAKSQKKQQIKGKFGLLYPGHWIWLVWIVLAGCTNTNHQKLSPLDVIELGDGWATNTVNTVIFRHHALVSRGGFQFTGYYGHKILPSPVVKVGAIYTGRGRLEQRIEGLVPDKSRELVVYCSAGSRSAFAAKVLGEIGYTNVDEADDGSTALEKLRAGKFDFVVTDWNMPNMPGIELLKAIRSDAELKDTPVLMVTAEAAKENVVTAVQAGVNNYIVKPFTAAALKERIDLILQKVNQ